MLNDINFKAQSYNTVNMNNSTEYSYCNIIIASI